ncbi:unnamed protein product [Spirodela intermedia]|uniref:Isopenicillin N synthase-like Fe(2+) 2OG dioxygenase domain-containing protein n=1 Tax=Spirodela intermedia TaxID=51605 RepID=A0ABN7EA37_SPIIN|nr:unnamed protein product [Spirodela intermedia]
MRLSTSFNVKKETVRNWRDYLRLHCYLLRTSSPTGPPIPLYSSKDVVSGYCREVRRLGFRLMGIISESLGLEKDYIVKVLGEQEQHMAINYYPACPAPDLTYGLPAHTDPNALTILLQDPQVDPHACALVVNIGDQLQALSNGQYKSVWHRAVVNQEGEDVGGFLPRALQHGSDQRAGEAHQRRRASRLPGFTYAEYYQKFWSRNLDQEHCLELFKC